MESEHFEADGYCSDLRIHELEAFEHEHLIDKRETPSRRTLIGDSIQRMHGLRFSITIFFLGFAVGLVPAVIFQNPQFTHSISFCTNLLFKDPFTLANRSSSRKPGDHLRETISTCNGSWPNIRILWCPYCAAR
jgi:hypothetical protein